jgi:GT2 family glycosyltransferase
VTYNRKELLTQCIRQILAQKDAGCDVLVVDNASTDGTAEAVARIEDERVTYLNTGANLGGAGGFNLGVRYAVEHAYRRIWLMDDDVLPREDALARLCAADSLVNGDFGWLSSVALWIDGTECRMNRQKLMKAYYLKMDLLPKGMILAEQATFVSLFLNGDVVRQAGLPIKEFFIWGDDIEYTRRIAVREQKLCYLVCDSVVTHAMSGNQGSNIATDDETRLSRYGFAFRNEAFLYRAEGIRGVCYYLAKCGVTLIRILRYAPGQRLLRIRIVLGGMVRGALFHPKIEYVGDKTA